MLKFPVLMLIAAVLMTACSTTPTGRSQLLLMPDSQMNQMGLQAFENIKKKTPVEANASTNRYVACVANAVTREVGGSWEVVVFKDDSANAFALPGRKIGVNSGMLKVAKNQHQLAAVIGHEVAHVLANHSNERVSQQFAVEQGMNLINALTNPQTPTGQQMMGLLGVGAQYGILMPYGRAQESESDRIGLEIMAKAGFDPAESVKLWHNMSAAGGAQPPEFLSTHPSHGTRIRLLNDHLATAQALQQAATRQGKRPACTAGR